MLAPTAPFLEPAIILIQSTAVSLVIIITGITTGITPSHARAIKTPLTKILSAIASNTLPKSVTSPLLRAMLPSKKSVTLAIINNTPQIIYYKLIVTFPAIKYSGKTTPIS